MEEIKTTLRWGIAASGKICNDFVAALSTLPEGNHQVIAVASRDIARAEIFAKKFQIPKYYGSYEDLAADKEIDIVYIGTIHPCHYEVGMLMLENNKHLLCEKPLCMNEKQCRKLIIYAERKKLFLMEGIWSRFFPAYRYLKKQIKSDVLGKIQEIQVSFGFDCTENDRTNKKDLGGGALLDLGIYCIQLSQWAFEEPPISITAKAKLNDELIDVDLDCQLHYSGGGLTSFRACSNTNLDNYAIIKGSKAQIKLNQFWCPTTIIDIDGHEKTWLLPETDYEMNFINSAGLSYEAEEARKCVLAGNIQSDHITHNDSLLLANIEDKIRKQINVVYKEDVN